MCGNGKTPDLRFEFDSPSLSPLSPGHKQVGNTTFYSCHQNRNSGEIFKSDTCSGNGNSHFVEIYLISSCVSRKVEGHFLIGSKYARVLISSNLPKVKKLKKVDLDILSIAKFPFSSLTVST